MTTPASKDELRRYTPPSLVNVTAPPVFILRPVTGRDARLFRRSCMEEGLIYHAPESMRAEQLRGLKLLWSEADYEAGKARLEAVWDALDQGVAVSPAELIEMEQLLQRLGRAYAPIRKMIADGQDFESDAPRIALTLFVVGWENLDAPYRRDAGLVPLGTIDAMEAALVATENKAKADKVEGVTPGLAYNQLAAEVLTTMNLTSAERQDFTSPSSSPSTPTASTTAGQATDGAGRSPGGRTPKTPRGGSRKITAI